ncbi:MAG: dihydroorotase [Oscillospiraceae bacterium]|nr:dihydroorotase [Oscillospiraceae bacterium]
MFEQRDDITILPGFVDLHVHFREPGFSVKETVASGSRAALRGGYAAVCAMPNLNPPPDTLEHLRIELDIIARSSRLPVFPVGCVTMGQRGEGVLSEMERLAPHVCGFSDDGVGVNDGALMREAMERAKACGKPILSHCEDKSLGDGPESEWAPLARDLELARETGCRYHVCHVSTKESVELIRRAKRDGAPVSAETAPHYLLLTAEDAQDDGRFRMNPPLRGEADRAALLAGLLDGTLDCVATDHAPHTREEKSRGFRGSACGIVGLETAFPVLYTRLVRTGIMPLEKLVDVMADAPRRLLESWTGRAITGTYAWELDKRYTIDPETFESKGRSTPFAGWEVYGALYYA